MPSRSTPSPPDTARPILWLFEDQLSLSIDALTNHPQASILLIESDHHYRTVPFHKHRIAFLVSAMRHFAQELHESGRIVHHYPFSPSGYRDSFSAVRHVIQTTGQKKFLVIDPSEHHTRVWLEELTGRLGIDITFLPNTMFLTNREEFAAWARSLKSPVMEHFYRRQRVKFDVLMDGKEPVGGAWNFDKLNRKPPKAGLRPPEPPRFTPDEITREVLKEVARRFPDHPGDVKGFALPVTRADAQAALEDFITHRLPLFGDYEDAMVTGQPFLFHSFLSPQLNAGLLTPMECIRAAERAYSNRKAPIHAVEGFVRQILGWREYVYGIYHTFMPGYRNRNARGSDRPLPEFFWTGQTEMNCLHQTIGGLLEHAYTHHIQRLMILCNFATLAGISPQAVNDWFYAMYADSHDWVVTPNVIGMGMNADGLPRGAKDKSKGTGESGGRFGTMATKPYVSSAAYINKMSDYCKGCRYDPGSRDAEVGCPFNYLFWTFLHHYRELYAGNPRMTMMLKNVERIPKEEMKQMMLARKKFLEKAYSAHSSKT